MTQKHYIHDRTRGFVGNAMIWWKTNHHGYTCNVDDAHVFSREQALQRIRDADDLTAYTTDSVHAYAEVHVTDRGALNPLVEAVEDGQSKPPPTNTRTPMPPIKPSREADG